MVASQIIIDKAPAHRLYVCDHCGLNYRPLESEGAVGVITTNSNLQNEVFCPACLDVLFASDESYKFVNKEYRPEIFPFFVNESQFSYQVALKRILTVAVLRIRSNDPKNMIYTASNGLKYSLRKNRGSMDKLYFDQLKLEGIFFKGKMADVSLDTLHKTLISDITCNVKFLPKVNRLIELIELKIFSIKEIENALNIAFEEE